MGLSYLGKNWGPAEKKADRFKESRGGGRKPKCLRDQEGKRMGKLKDNPQVRRRKQLPKSEDRVVRRGLSGRSCDLHARDAVDLN